MHLEEIATSFILEGILKIQVRLHLKKPEEKNKPKGPKKRNSNKMGIDDNEVDTKTVKSLAT